MKRYAATLAYNGAAYFGFQRQPDPTPTIQRAVENAIARVTGYEAPILAAGRTDTGVHALGQVIAFDADWKHAEQELLCAVNAHLPADIALQHLWQQDDFHPRFDALWRQYAYRIMTPPVRNPLCPPQVWQLVGQTLDLTRMRLAAENCLGEMDFAAFGTPPQADSSNTVRDIFVSEWESAPSEYGEVFTYRVRGTAFLYHMVRRMVGAMVQVGTGRITLEDFEDILRSRDIERAKLLAPPEGLVLEAVRYQEHELDAVNAEEPALALDWA